MAAALLLSACVTGTSTSTNVDERSATALYMDAQEYQLKRVLADSGVAVERARDDIILRMPGAATFEPDKADIKPVFRESVAAAAQVLKAYDRTLIEVDGYTDSSGAMIRNMALSLERAEAVAQQLMSQGIADTRITPIGMGPLQPLADNDSVEGRQLNRRVELTIRPLPHPR